MPLPSGLRAAGEIFDKMGIQPEIEIPMIGINSRPEDPIKYIDQMGDTARIVTGNPFFGGVGVDMNPEFESSINAQTRLNNLRNAGYY